MRNKLLAVLALAGSSTVARAQVAPHTVVGCYAFFDRAGRSAAESLYYAPATARLDSGGHAVKLSPKFDRGQPRGPGSFRWSLGGPGDSLRVLFHSGFSGTEFVFGQPVVSDTLHGRAVEHWDSGPPFRTNAGTATAVRIECPRTPESDHVSPDT